VFRNFLLFLTVLAVWGWTSQALAGGAVARRQQASQQIRVHQQVVVQQHVQQQMAAQAAAMAQQQAQQAAAQAVMMAQHQAQRAAAQAAAQAVAAQQHMAQQAVAGQVIVQRQIQQQGLEEALEAGLRQKMSEDAGLVQDITTLDDMEKALDTSSEAWSLMMDLEAKAVVVREYLQRFRDQGIQIRKPASYYAQLIDSMAAQSPEMLARPFEQIVQTMAIIEYDFDNGYSKDAMALKILGSKQAVQANKQRLGIQ